MRFPSTYTAMFLWTFPSDLEEALIPPTTYCLEEFEIREQRELMNLTKFYQISLCVRCMSSGDPEMEKAHKIAQAKLRV